MTAARAPVSRSVILRHQSDDHTMAGTHAARSQKQNRLLTGCSLLSGGT